MGNGEGDPYQYRRKYVGYASTNTNGEAGHKNKHNWLFRKRGSRGRIGVAVSVAVFGFCMSFLILSVISSFYNINHRNLNEYEYYDNDAPKDHHQFRLVKNDNDNNNNSITTRNMNTNINHNHNHNNNERMYPRKGNKNNTIKTGNIAVRLPAYTIDILTGNTTTSSKPAANIPPPCDWLDDINTNTNNTKDILQCGVNKCAYHSTRSRRISSNDNRSSSSSSSSSSQTSQTQTQTIRYGYLVIDEGKKSLQKNQQSYEFAQHLTKTFSNFRHTLLAPPIRTDSKECSNYRPIDKEFTDKLNGATFTNRYLKTFQPNRPLVIQPIELLPQGFLLFKCDKLSYEKANENILKQDFTTTTTTTTPLLSHVVDDFHEWEHQLRWDLNVTVSLLEHKAEGECLGKDFQIVFDKYNGRMIHIDLDRCFERKKKNRWKSDCKEKLITFTEKMINIKRPQK